MPPEALALVCAAAVLHVGWNTLAKRAGDPFLFLWSSMALAGLLLAPWAALRAHSGWARAAWPYGFVSMGIHAAYFYTLGRSYRWGDLSQVYPVARGLSVALVPLVAWLLLAERVAPAGGLGIGLVVCGIVTVGRAAPAGAARHPRAGTALAWAGATGLLITSYSLIDKLGVGRLDPLPYVSALGLGASALLSPVVLAHRAELRAEWRRSGRAIALAATMNLTGYLLVLYAFRLAPVGYVVASRELSIVLSVLVGALWLREGHLGRRLAGAAAIVIGVACIALSS